MKNMHLNFFFFKPHLFLYLFPYIYLFINTFAWATLHTKLYHKESLSNCFHFIVTIFKKK